MTSLRAILRFVRKPRTCDSCHRRASTRRGPKTHEARFVGDTCVCKHCWRTMQAVTQRLQDIELLSPSTFVVPTFMHAVTKQFYQQSMLRQQFADRNVYVSGRGDFIVPLNLPSRYPSTVTVTKQE